MSQSQLRGQLVTLCAGIAAENLVFGEGSTGGEQDLENATNLARDMVARYGMSADLGPVRLLAKSSEGFLNEDIPLADISYETRQALDVAIRRLIADAQADATTLLARHRKTLDGLAERLMAQETLEGDELLQVLAPIEKEMATEVISAKPVRSKSPSNGTRRTTRPRTGAGR
jgi:cell division protease FtsH